MVNQSLVNFIETELKNKRGKQEIKKYLLDYDHSSEEIDESFKYVDFKHKLNHKPKKNRNDLTLSILAIFLMSVILSSGAFFMLKTDNMELERYSPEVEEIEIPPTIIELSKNDQRISMNLNQITRFRIDGRFYDVELIRLEPNYSEFYVLSLKEVKRFITGQETPLDINGDGFQDISLRLIISTSQKLELNVKQLEKNINHECNKDIDCDDGLINTKNECVDKLGIRKCFTEIKEMCKDDEDCDEFKNKTGLCIKENLVSYCQYYDRDLCKTNEDCEDGNLSTKGTCVILKNRQNYCVQREIKSLDCGKSKDLKKNVTKDDALECFGIRLRNNVKAKVEYVEGNNSIIFEIIKLKNNEIELYLDIINYKNINLYNGTIKNKEFYCEYGHSHLLNISNKNLKGEEINDSVKLAKNFYFNVLSHLFNNTNSFQNGCEGNLLSILNP